MPFGLLIPLAAALMPGYAAECPVNPVPDDPAVVLGYVAEERQTGDTHIGPFRVLALLRGSDIRDTDGEFTRDGLKFWSVLTPESAPFELSQASSFVYRVSTDHCVYHAWFRDRTPPTWTLLSSKPLRGAFREPGDSEREYFFAHNTSCVDQGDYEPEEQPPCTRPQLLAVSDLDHDGSAEFWATQPYMWDTGIKIWRQTPSGLEAVLEVAVGASD